MALMTRAQEQKLEDAKKVFSRMVAHELRTPLVSITMVQEIISRNLERLSTAEIQQLETDVLNPEALRTHGRPVTVRELLKTAVELGRKFATRDQNVQLHCSDNSGQAAILCDSRALKHARRRSIPEKLAG